MAEAGRWTSRAFLRGDQDKTDAKLSARQSIYAYRHPRGNLAATVLDLVALGPLDTVINVGCGNGAAHQPGRRVSAFGGLGRPRGTMESCLNLS